MPDGNDKNDKLEPKPEKQELAPHELPPHGGTNAGTIFTPSATSAAPSSHMDEPGQQGPEASSDPQPLPTSDPLVLQPPDDAELEKVEKASQAAKKGIKYLVDTIESISPNLRPETYTEITRLLEEPRKDSTDATNRFSGESIQRLGPTIKHLSDTLERLTDPIMLDPKFAGQDFVSNMAAARDSLKSLLEKLPSVPPYSKQATQALNQTITDLRNALIWINARIQESTLQLPPQLKDTFAPLDQLLETVQGLLPKVISPPLRTLTNGESVTSFGLPQQPSPGTRDPVNGGMIQGGGVGALAEGDNFFGKLKGVPIDYLISTPLMAAARSNLALAEVMVQFINIIGFKEDGATRLVEFKLQRPYINPDSGMPGPPVNIEVKAPLLGLVPLPALLIQSVNIDLTVEISNKDLQKSESTSNVTAGVNVKFPWGFGNANFTAEYSTKQEHTRETNQSAKYVVRVLAEQQQLPEGMSKLMDVMASCIQPMAGK